MAMRRRFMQDSRIDVNRYFTFVARENNTSVSLINSNLNIYGFSDIQYSINGEHFIKGNVDNIIINSGETLSVKATYHAPLVAEDMVVISKPVDVIGTISSIFASANNYRYIFCYTPIVDASLLSLPATTLTDGCYSYMFHNCTSLTTAPELPATTLAYGCYYYMFSGCTSLTTAPALPATTLADSCYYNMFNCCTSLTTAPELPATTLAYVCYDSMFYGCTSLITAPELPATTLASWCYHYMFRGCKKLNYIKMLATDISASNCLFDWVSGVASTGTFVKNPSMTSLPTDDNSGIPAGWTVVNDGEESNGDGNKVVNKVQLVNDGIEWDFVFDYPVNSNLQVNFADGLVYVSKGTQQSSTGYPGFDDKPTIVGIDPLEDDKYIYTW